MRPVKFDLVLKETTISRGWNDAGTNVLCSQS